MQPTRKGEKTRKAGNIGTQEWFWSAELALNALHESQPARIKG